MPTPKSPQGRGANQLTPGVRKSRLKTLIDNVQEESEANNRKVDDNRRMSETWARLGPKYGWNYATFVTEYWPLRYKLVSVGRKTEWDLFLDRERKRLKAEPRKNARVKDMTADDAKRHRKEQNRLAKQAERARKAVPAAVASVHPLTVDQLEVIRLAEAQQAASPADVELSDLLATLKAAEEG